MYPTATRRAGNLCKAAYRLVSDPFESQSLRCVSMCLHTQEPKGETSRRGKGNKEGTSREGSEWC
jgi:hypothetical protein